MNGGDDQMKVCKNTVTSFGGKKKKKKQTNKQTKITSRKDSMQDK